MKYRRLTIALPMPQLELTPSASWLRRWLPTPGNALFTFLVVVGLLWAQNAGATMLGQPAAASATSGTVAYQGRLANAAGQPLTGTYPMVFRLYSAAAGGTPLWTEQWTASNSVQVSDGLFNVMLGSLTPIPVDTVSSSSSLFLGISVGTDGEMAPRVQLGSVPFAAQALTVPDQSVTTSKLADGAVTSAKLDRTLIRVAPTGPVAMPAANAEYEAMATNFVLGRRTLVSLDVSVGLFNAADGLMAVSVQVDGAAVIVSHKWQKGGIGEQHMLSTALLLDAGQHSISVKTSSWLANSVVVEDTRTQLVVVLG